MNGESAGWGHSAVAWGGGEALSHLERLSVGSTVAECC